MGGDLASFLLIFAAPMVIGFGLPRIIRRTLLVPSLIVFAISLRGTGIHDTLFLVYVVNAMLLIGIIVREVGNVIMRAFTALTARRNRT
jgi:hypothetical protein